MKLMMYFTLMMVMSCSNVKADNSDEEMNSITLSDFKIEMNGFNPILVPRQPRGFRENPFEEQKDPFQTNFKPKRQVRILSLSSNQIGPFLNSFASSSISESELLKAKIPAIDQQG